MPDFFYLVAFIPCQEWLLLCCLKKINRKKVAIAPGKKWSNRKKSGIIPYQKWHYNFVSLEALRLEGAENN